VEAKKFVLDAITALPQVNVYLLMWKPKIFVRVHTLKTDGHIKPNTAVDETGYKWETADGEKWLHRPGQELRRGQHFWRLLWSQ
jgi:hypothetical protein